MFQTQWGREGEDANGNETEEGRHEFAKEWVWFSFSFLNLWVLFSYICLRNFLMGEFRIQKHYSTNFMCFFLDMHRRRRQQQRTARWRENREERGVAVKPKKRSNKECQQGIIKMLFCLFYCILNYISLFLLRFLLFFYIFAYDTT